MGRGCRGESGEEWLCVPELARPRLQHFITTSWGVQKTGLATGWLVRALPCPAPVIIMKHPVLGMEGKKGTANLVSDQLSTYHREGEIGAELEPTYEGRDTL